MLKYQKYSYVLYEVCKRFYNTNGKQKNLKLFYCKYEILRYNFIILIKQFSYKYQQQHLFLASYYQVRNDLVGVIYSRIRARRLDYLENYEIMSNDVRSLIIIKKTR